MAGGNSDLFKNQLALAINAKDNGKRYRGENVSEIQVNCLECSIKPKTYRKMAVHYNKEHKSHLVMGMGCDFCTWKCSESLGCFISHMSQQHGRAVYMNTHLPLEAIKKYQAKHSPICTNMKSELVWQKRQLLSKQNREATILRKTAKRAEKAAAKLAEKAAKKISAKKGKKVVHAKVKEDTLGVHTESLMVEHTVCDWVESLDEFLGNEAAVIEGSGSLVANNAISAETVERITNIPNRNIETQDKTDDEIEEVDDDYLGDEEYTSSFSSDEDDDDTTPAIPCDLTRVFLENLEKKRLEKKRKAPSSDSDDDGIEVLREYKKKQIFTYV